MLMRFQRLQHRGELKLRLELPERGPTTIEFSVDPDRLTIHSIETRSTDWEIDGDFLHLGDGTPAPIGLEIPLPIEVDPDSARARIADGVLDLTFAIQRCASRADLVVPVRAATAPRSALAVSAGAQ